MGIVGRRYVIEISEKKCDPKNKQSRIFREHTICFI
jgi:hypothetical protein